MAYSEIPLESLYYDPELPTRTMTPAEWKKIFGIVDLEKHVKGSKFDNPQYDEYIIRSYVEQGLSLEKIGNLFGLSYQFIKTRLQVNKIEMRVRGTHKRKAKK